MSIKKRIRPGKIEPSPDAPAIVVHFTTELTYLDEDGETDYVEKVPDSREVPLANELQGLRSEDIPLLAQKVVERCRYIPATKLRQVEQVLTKLVAVHSHLLGAASPERSGAPSRSVGSNGWDAPSSQASNWRPADMLPWASVDKIDDYVEALYEDAMEAKADGAQKLLRLSAEVRNLEEIAEHPTLLGVLSRELRENAKRSHQLAVSVCGIFLCLAHFSQFHSALSSHQCGDAMVRIFEYETRRREMLKKELKLQQGQMVARGSSVSAEERRKLEQEERKYRILFERQDRLLLMCLLVLRNVVEDPAVEFSLVKQRLGHFLLALLIRGAGEDLMLTTLGLLHLLSRVQQNKDQFVQNGDAMNRLAELAGHQHPELSLTALRVCYNLCFDERGRSVLATQTSLVAKLPPALQQSGTRKVAFKVLYQLSTDPSLRSAIAKSAPECISLALHAVVKAREHRPDPEGIALCINFAADEACAMLLVKSEGFHKAAMRGIHGADPLMLKVLRHVAAHASVHRRFFAVMRVGEEEEDAWLQKLVRVAAASSNRPEVIVEAVGLLAALDCSSKEVPWVRLCEAGVLELLHRLLMVGFSDDDVQLECIILVGNLALNSDCVPLLATSKVPRLLADLLAEKEDDVDLISQLLFAVRCLLQHEETREVVFRDTDVVGQILEMLRSTVGKALDPPDQFVHAVAEDVLDWVVAADSSGESELVRDIKAYRFEAHNFEWCHRQQHNDRHGHAERLEPPLSVSVSAHNSREHRGRGGGGHDGYAAHRHRST